jgi:hypothetical protein
MAQLNINFDYPLTKGFAGGCHTRQEPLNARTYHGKIRISIDGWFWPLLLQWLYFPLRPYNFWNSQPIWPSFFDMRSGEWSLQLIYNHKYWETFNTKKGQKRPKIAKDGQNLVRLLQWLYWPVKGHNFWMITRFDPLFLLWPYQTDILTFYSWIIALSRIQRELEQNRLRDMSFDLGVLVLGRSEQFFRLFLTFFHMFVVS